MILETSMQQNFSYIFPFNSDIILAGPAKFLKRTEAKTATRFGWCVRTSGKRNILGNSTMSISSTSPTLVASLSKYLKENCDQALSRLQASSRNVPEMFLRYRCQPYLLYSDLWSLLMIGPEIMTFLLPLTLVRRLRPSLVELPMVNVEFLEVDTIRQLFGASAFS